MNSIKKLKESLNKVIQEYIDLFCEKHELDFDYWVGDIVGELACFGDFYFNFTDIKYDIENEIQKETIFLWYYDTIETHPNIVNYSSFCKGIRETQSQTLKFLNSKI